MAANQIGTQKENSLHASLKEYYYQAGDQIEIDRDRYVIDIARGDLLLEIQTANFSGLKKKVRELLRDYRVRIIHPIPKDRWVVRLGKKGKVQSRRKSPKHGRPIDLFDELVGLVDLVGNPGFSLEIALTEEEVVWLDDGRGSWRRKGWSVADRTLVQVYETYRYGEPQEYLTLLPNSLETTFTNADLSKQLKIRRRLAEKVTYCLRKMGVIEQVGVRNRFKLYSIVD